MTALRNLIVVTAAFLLLPAAAGAQEIDLDRAAKIKSAYLLNFIRYASWPATAFESPGAPLFLCVAGVDSLGGHLDMTMRGQAAGGRDIEIVRLNTPRAAPPDVRCHMLFIGESELARTADLLATVAAPWTLTVGETRAFVALGAMLALSLEQNRFVFHANDKAIRAASVQLSSKILQLARIAHAAERAGLR